MLRRPGPTQGSMEYARTNWPPSDHWIKPSFLFARRRHPLCSDRPNFDQVPFAAAPHLILTSASGARVLNASLPHCHSALVESLPLISIGVRVLTVIFPGKRMPGARRTARSDCGGAVIGGSGPACATVCGCGPADRRAAPPPPGRPRRRGLTVRGFLPLPRSRARWTCGRQSRISLPIARARCTPGLARRPGWLARRMRALEKIIGRESCHKSPTVVRLFGRSLRPMGRREPWARIGHSQP